MNIILWIGIVAGIVGLLALVLGAVSRDPDAGPLGVAIGGAALVIGLIFGVWGAMPQWTLYRATVEKRILVEQARAEADSAVEYKRAEITRAEGVAEANIIVAGSITEQYLRYLFVNNLGQTSNQIIYVPTEANLPILEADRLGVNDTTEGD